MAKRFTPILSILQLAISTVPVHVEKSYWTGRATGLRSDHSPLTPIARRLAQQVVAACGDKEGSEGDLERLSKQARVLRSRIF